MNYERFKVGDRVRFIKPPTYNGATDRTSLAKVGSVHVVEHSNTKRNLSSPHVVVAGHWCQEDCLEFEDQGPSTAELLATFASIGGDTIAMQIAGGKFDAQLHEINLAVANRLVAIEKEDHYGR